MKPYLLKLAMILVGAIAMPFVSAAQSSSAEHNVQKAQFIL
jgi:hypothetical protein